MKSISNGNTNMLKSFETDETIDSMRNILDDISKIGVVYGEIYDSERSEIDISLSKATHVIQSIDINPRSGSCIINTKILTTKWGKYIQEIINDGISISLSPRGIYSPEKGKKIYTFDIKIN